ncbi:MAG TPA: hypothetical protein VH643_06830 [Gemmataceae bacterium]|jgi:hypothetical protein
MALAQQPSPSSGPSYGAWPTPIAAGSAPQRIAVAQAAQQPKGPKDKPAPAAPVRSAEQGLDLDQAAPVTIQLEPPGLERLALSVQSDAQLQERIRQENRERKTPERIVFPSDPVLSTDTYNGRKWYPLRMEVAPYYVCHGRLYFQQINFERYGWGLGVVTPFVSYAAFLWDFVTLPYQLAAQPCRCFEYNTGWCLPGDPVPLLLYPLEISATGFLAEAATIATLVAIFP